MNISERIKAPFELKPFQFEKQFNSKEWSTYVGDNWYWSIYASIIYVMIVYCGQIWMRSRPSFRLQKLLILWNLILSIGSILMFSRVWPYLWHEFKTNGVVHLVCKGHHHSDVTSFWYLIFPLSKILEFGDTLFIVARKQKLIFLHWYHHVTVAIYCFAFLNPVDPASRTFGAINSFIHFLMYGYYAMKAMGIKVPKQLSKGITSLQIAQMFIGLFVNLFSFYLKVNGEPCNRQYSSIFWTLGMYGSYLVLFLQFFKSAYNTSKPKETPTTSILINQKKQT